MTARAPTTDTDTCAYCAGPRRYQCEHCLRELCHEHTMFRLEEDVFRCEPACPESQYALADQRVRGTGEGAE